MKTLLGLALVCGLIVAASLAYVHEVRAKLDTYNRCPVPSYEVELEQMVPIPAKPDKTSPVEDEMRHLPLTAV